MTTLRRLAATAAVVLTLALGSRAMASPAQGVLEFAISPSGNAVTFLQHGKIIATRYAGTNPREVYVPISVHNRTVGIGEYYLNPQGGIGAEDEGGTILADTTGCFPSCFTFDTNNYLDVNVKTGTITTTMPLPGGSSTAVGAGQSVGIQAYDGVGNLVPLQESNGALLTLPQAQSASTLLGGYANIPAFQTYGANTVFVPQADFAVNQGTCTAVADPTLVANVQGTPNTSHYCWIFHTGAGILYSITWQSPNNMNSLAGAPNIVTCYDNTTNSGAVIWTASAGAGGWRDFNPIYGRPFTRGLTCAANHAFGTAATDALEVVEKY